MGGVPSGESIATFERTEAIFTAEPTVDINITGSSLTSAFLYNVTYPYDAQHRFTDGSGGSSTGTFTFTMTGKEFIFVYGGVASGCLDYTVWVDGVQLVTITVLR